MRGAHFCRRYTGTIMPLYQIGPNTWSNRDPNARTAARSELPVPNIISDTIEPTEQVDGRFYTSKAAFRRVGRAHGLTEVGTEKPRPRKRVDDRAGRRRAIEKAIARWRSGERPRREPRFS